MLSRVPLWILAQNELYLSSKTTASPHTYGQQLYGQKEEERLYTGPILVVFSIFRYYILTLFLLFRHIHS